MSSMAHCLYLYIHRQPSRGFKAVRAEASGLIVLPPCFIWTDNFVLLQSGVDEYSEMDTIACRGGASYIEDHCLEKNRVTRLVCLHDERGHPIF